MIPKINQKTRQWAGKLFAVLFTMLLASSLMTTQTFAQDVPDAGTQIGNQATATFTDANGNDRTVTSNVVNTVVQQVAGVTVQADLTKQVSPGGQVAFPFTITNDGNGDDTFTLTTNQQGGDDFNLTNLQVFADANGDGNPDNFTDLTGSNTPSLAPDEVFNVVVVGEVPNTETSGNSALVDLIGTSFADITVTDQTIGTAIVSENAVVSVSKALSQSTAQPNDGLTVTLTFTNSGNTAASAITIEDPLPANMSYVTGTGNWSEGGSLTDTDGASDDPAGITYDFNLTTAGAVTAELDNLAPGQSGTLTFDVTIDGGTPPGAIENTANFSYDDGTGTIVGDPTPINTNTAIVTVGPNLGVTISDGAESPISSVNQGGTATYTNTVTNTGNATDSYDITLSGSTFPNGTSFILFKPDGVTPLLDTDGNGVPDTGPIADGATFDVVVKANLPSNASGGPFQVNVNATSTTDNTVTDDGLDVLTAITDNTVDLTVNDDINNGNNLTTDPAAAADGLGDGNSNTGVKDTQTADPGATATFTLFVNNTSDVSDNFDMSADLSNLPPGATVEFRDNGTTITNTGVIGATSSKQIDMIVTIPASALAATNNITVTTESPNSGVSDVLDVAVDVNTIREITLTPNNSGQVFPGSSVLYTHTLLNSGNVTETSGGTELTVDDSRSGFSTVLYVDNNNDGQIDGGDVIITQASDIPSLAPTQSVQIIAKVSASSGVTEGLNNTTTLTATTTGDINGVSPPPAVEATDITTVIASNVIVTKEQALDADANGAIGDAGDGSLTNSQIQAEPGQGIFYEIVVTNQGTDTINSITLSDAVPPFTSINGNVDGTLPDGTAGTTSNTGGDITFTIPTLEAGESATLNFAVIIDN